MLSEADPVLLKMLLMSSMMLSEVSFYPSEMQEGVASRSACNCIDTALLYNNKGCAPAKGVCPCLLGQYTVHAT